MPVYFDLEGRYDPYSAVTKYTVDRRRQSADAVQLGNRFVVARLNEILPSKTQVRNRLRAGASGIRTPGPSK
jgi:hypothetical protein